MDNFYRKDEQHHDSPEQPVEGLERANFGNWTMTVQEAGKVFGASDSPRSERSIKRYCKNGTLVCRKFDYGTSRRWMIDPESVTDYLMELKEIADRKREIEGQRPQDDKSGQVMSGHGRTGQAMAGHTKPHESNKSEQETLKQDESESDTAKDGRIKELEAKVAVLEIDKVVGSRINEEFVKERQTFIEQISKQGREIGTLEQRLLQLAPPEAKVHESKPLSTHGDNSEVERNEQ